MLEMGFKLLDAIQTIRFPALDAVMIFFTHLGEAGAVWIALALFCLLRKKTRSAGLAAAYALLLSFLISNVLLKPLIARPRPFMLHDVQLLIAAPSGWSFPSGHASASFAAATALAPSVRRWQRIALFALAALISLSRLYLYVHFPGDVLCGMLFGILYGLLSRYISAKWHL